MDCSFPIVFQEFCCETGRPAGSAKDRSTFNFSSAGENQRLGATLDSFTPATPRGPLQSPRVAPLYRRHLLSLALNCGESLVEQSNALVYIRLADVERRRHADNIAPETT